MHDNTSNGVVMMIASIAMITVGVILSTVLALGGSHQPSASGAWLIVVGVPFFALIAIAMGVAYLLMRFILGSVR